MYEEKLNQRIPSKYFDGLKLFLLLFLVFTLFAHTIGDNETSRLATTIALVEDNSLSIDRIHESTGDKALLNGTYYSDKAPLSSFLAVPSYMLVDSYFDYPLEDDYYLKSFRRSFEPKMEWARFAATVSVSAVAGALTGTLIYLISLNLGLNREESIFLGVFSGLGTLIFPYSTTFHGTMLGTFFLLSAVYLWIKEDYSPSANKSFLMALLIGLGVSASYLIIVPGGILLLLNITDRFKEYSLYIFSVSGLLAGLVPVLLFHYFTTGNPLEPPLLHAVEAVDHPEGGGMSVLLNIYTIFAKILRSLFDPLNGLLVYTPITVFGLIGLRRLYGYREKLFWFITGSFLVSLILVNMLLIWQLRAFYGPRYLLPVATLLIIPLALKYKYSGLKEKTLIYISGLLSVLFMFSSTRGWVGSGWIDPLGAHKDRMLSFGFYENRLTDYVYSLPSEGLQSPILSYLTGASSEFHMVLSSYPQYSFYLGEFFGRIIVYDIRFLTFSFILGAGILLFKDYFTGRNTYRLIIGLSLLSGLVISGASATDYYMHDWYDPLEGKEEIWGQQEPEIYFVDNTSDGKIAEIDIRSRQERHLELVMNNEQVGNYTVDPSGLSINTELDTRRGVNKLEFKTDRCDVIGRDDNSSDHRCVTTGISDINFTESGEEYLLTSLEEDPRGYREVNENSEITFLQEGVHSLNMEVHSNERTSIQILKNGETVAKGNSDNYPSYLRTGYIQINKSNSFTFEKTCDNCSAYIREFEFIRKEDTEEIESQLGSSWYKPAENEDLTWSAGSPTVNIYNPLNRSIEAEIQLEGRSFNQTRNIEFLLNQNKMGESKVTGENTAKALEAELIPGSNILKLDIEESCTVIGEVIGNDDIRCVSYGLENIQISR